MCCNILPEARKCQEGWRSTLSGGSHLTFTQETRVCVPPNTINHFLNPKIWLWTWNRIWAAVCISIRAGGNELWRITHRHIETVRFNVRIRIVVPALQNQSDGWKFIKGYFQSTPLDITKFTERWKPIETKIQCIPSFHRCIFTGLLTEREANWHILLVSACFVPRLPPFSCTFPPVKNT